MKKLFGALVTALMIGTAGSAFAGPIQLTDQQMDAVTAGADAGVGITLLAFAAGGVVAVTNTTGGGGIVQIPINFMFAGNPVSLLGGAVFAFGSSTSAN